jgi:hypothetical protein
MHLRRRIRLIVAAIRIGRAFHADFGRVQIGPLDTGFGTKAAIALVDIIGPFQEFDTDPAAMACEIEHPRLLPAEPVDR